MSRQPTIDVLRYGRPSAAPPGRPAALTAAVVVGLLGLVLLLLPMAGDQTLAIVMGRRMRDGAVLYRDVWDIRQPFVYIWFTAIGWLGTSAVVVNVAHTIWHAALAAVVARDIAVQTGRPRHGVVVAIAAVAPLFWTMRSNDIGQPDTLVLLPLYLVFRVAVRPSDRPLRARDLCWIGLATSGIALVKVVYAPLPVMFLVVRALHERSHGRALARQAVAFVAGVVLVAAATVAYAAANGILGWVGHTWLVQGPRMRSLAPPPFSRMVVSVGRVIVGGLPIWVAAVIALGRWWRRRDLRTTCLVVWSLGAGAAFLAQSWWSYQALALVLPIGLLAGPVLVEWMERRWVRRGSVLAITVLMLAVHLSYVQAIAEHGFDVTAIERELDPERSVADEVRQFLDRPGRLDGDVYVLGHPKVMFHAGREELISIHGWSTEYYDHETWDRLAGELREDPPAYLVTEPGAIPPLIERAQTLWAWIEDGYRHIATFDGDIEIWECSAACGR